MALDQNSAPLWEALVDFCAKKQVSFHTPGHKHGQGLDEELLLLTGFGLGRIDVTELPGLDNLHYPRGAIREAQSLAAQACGAKQSFFLVNGASCGIQAMVLACCSPGDKLIIPRDAHVSVHTALILSGVEPIYLYPEIDSDSGVILGITVEHLQRTLEKHPEVKALLLVNPNYYGICSDMVGLIRVAKSFGKPVLVDEAHGAHLYFHNQLPPSAGEMGADLWVQSTHKMTTSLTQTGLLHVGSDKVDVKRIQAALSIVQSTSPSYLLMGSIDIARRQMATRGKQIFDQLLSQVSNVRRRLAAVPGVKFFETQKLPTGKGFSCDPLKLLLNFEELGLTGIEAAQMLRDAFDIECELADTKNVLLVFGPGNIEEDFLKLSEACLKLEVSK
jgi:arginine/lysine/ornithine decarboxylase